MKSPRSLYLVKRIKPRDEGPTYDQNIGHVISATSAARARKLAAYNSRDEGDMVWFDTARVAVTVLADDSAAPEGIVLTSHHAG